MVTTQENRSNTALKSSFLEYLPALYRDDEFMGQFLLIFEDILKPIGNTVDNLELYLDPRMIPEELLPWLASWLDLALNSGLPIGRQRELVAAAAELYRWRGTRRGLAEYLRIYTGYEPEISEYIQGMSLDTETRLGVDTRLGSSGTGNHFTVTLEAEEDGAINIDTVKAIIEAQKPAQAAYTLQVNNRNR